MKLKILITILLTTVVFAQDYKNMKVLKVISVYDANHIKVQIKDSEIEFAIADIVSPKYKANCFNEKIKAQELRDYIKTILSTSKNIELRNIQKTDTSYKANIFINGNNINSKLIEKEYVFNSKYKGNNPWCNTQSVMKTYEIPDNLTELGWKGEPLEKLDFDLILIIKSALENTHTNKQMANIYKCSLSTLTKNISGDKYLSLSINDSTNEIIKVLKKCLVNGEKFNIDLKELTQRIRKSSI